MMRATMKRMRTSSMSTAAVPNPRAIMVGSGDLTNSKVANGKETMATRVFGRLTAWQNWIFQRPNAVGDKGALKVYGKGDKAAFDMNRV